jgi:hypothetical protein
MKYYYLDGIDKLGPYSLEEILSRNLSPDTMIFREDKSNWHSFSEFEELNFSFNEIKDKIEAETILDIRKKKIEDKTPLKKNKVSKKVLIGSLLAFLLVISYFAYQRFSFNENVARETSNRFFNMLIMNNANDEEIEKLYPAFSSIGYRIKFNSICTINNISRNSEGDYEVYASYVLNKVKNYPIYLVVSRDGNKVYIKSSKGINYAYYDKVLDYGIKKGCLTGNEDDIKMGFVITEKKLRSELESKMDYRIKSLYNNIKTNSDIKTEWGSISGNVTITNNNDIDFDYFDFECNVEFYNSSGQITSSEKVYSVNAIKAYESVSGRVFCSSQNSKTYKIIPLIKYTDDIKNKIKDKIIEYTQYGCN